MANYKVINPFGQHVNSALSPQEIHDYIPTNNMHSNDLYYWPDLCKYIQKWLESNGYLHKDDLDFESDTALKAFYKKLCLTHHPDKGGNPEIFKLLTWFDQAHQVLASKVYTEIDLQPCILPASNAKSIDLDIPLFNQYTSKLNLKILNRLLPWSNAKRLYSMRNRFWNYTLVLNGLALPVKEVKLFIVIAYITKKIENVELQYFNEQFRELIDDYKLICMHKGMRANRMDKYDAPTTSDNFYHNLLVMMIKSQLKEVSVCGAEITRFQTFSSTHINKFCLILVAMLYLPLIWFSVTTYLPYLLSIGVAIPLLLLGLLSSYKRIKPMFTEMVALFLFLVVSFILFVMLDLIGLFLLSSSALLSLLVPIIIAELPTFISSLIVSIFMNFCFVLNFGASSIASGFANKEHQSTELDELIEQCHDQIPAALIDATHFSYREPIDNTDIGVLYKQFEGGSSHADRYNQYIDSINQRSGFFSNPYTFKAECIEQVIQNVDDAFGLRSLDISLTY